jgi:DNA-binding MarR family transcriptional regulator
MAESKTDLERVASALNSGAIHLLRSLAAVDRLAGLTPARLSALSVLVFAGPRSLGELAAAEGVAGPTMTRIVDGLAGLRLAERRRHPSDGRAVEIAATGPGERLMRDAAQRRIDAIVLVLGGLAPADRQRLAAAADLLDRVASDIRQQEPGVVS